MSVVVRILIALHGLVTLAIGAGTLSGGPPSPDMSRLPGAAWYPIPLGQSWLLRDSMSQLGGALWIVAGVGLLATAAAFFGIFLGTSVWRIMGLGSALIGVTAIAMFFHPYYVIALLTNLAIIAAAVFEASFRRVSGT